MFLHSGFSKSAWKSMFDDTGDPPVIKLGFTGVAVVGLSASFSVGTSLAFSLLLEGLLPSSFSEFTPLASDVESEEGGSLLGSAHSSLEAPEIEEPSFSGAVAVASSSFSFLRIKQMRV